MFHKDRRSSYQHETDQLLGIAGIPDTMQKFHLERYASTHESCYNNTQILLQSRQYRVHGTHQIHFERQL
jgi:hypothetical protein